MSAVERVELLKEQLRLAELEVREEALAKARAKAVEVERAKKVSHWTDELIRIPHKYASLDDVSHLASV